MENFNFCIGHYYPDGQINVYIIHNPNFFGSLETAKEILNYVKNKSPNKDWKIFKLEEVNQE